MADLSAGTGMGSSSSYTVGLIKGLNAMVRRYISTQELAEEACKIEIDLVGKPIGKQDQYAAVLGGINFLKFNNSHQVTIERIKLRTDIKRKLESRLFLDYTGPRMSSDINDSVVKNFLNKNKKTVEVFKEIIENVKHMRSDLKNNDLEHFADCLNREWALRKKLHPQVTTKKIEERIKFAMDNGASAAKVCGAGGGGSILFYAENKKELIKKFHNKLIPFKFDNEGLRTWTK